MKIPRNTSRCLILFLFGILLLSLFLRLFQFFAQIDDHHGWRQAQNIVCSSQIISLGWEGFFFPIFPGYGISGHVCLELPLIQLLVAMIFKLGIPFELAGRIVGIFFSLAQGALLFIWVRHSTRSARLGLISAALWGILPLSVYYGRTTVLEIPAVFFFSLFLFAFQLWASGFRLFHFWLWVISGTVLGLIRPNFLVVLSLVLLRQIWLFRKEIWKGNFFRLLIGLGMIVSITVGWRGIADNETLRLNPSMAFQNLLGHYFGNSFSSALSQIQVVFSRELFEGFLFSHIGILLLLLGFFSRKNYKISFLGPLRWGIFGFLIYICVFPNLNFQHTYYSLVVYSVAVPIMANGFDVFIRRATKRQIFRLIIAVFVLISIGKETIEIFSRLTRPTVPDTQIYAAISRQFIPSGKRVSILTPFWSENLLHRYLIPGAFESKDVVKFDKKELARIMGEGFDYLLIEDPIIGISVNPLLSNIIPKSALITYNQYVAIADLAKIPGRRTNRTK
ncbi:MAG: hypothetical protein HQM08_00605 [Candidatus Riflebacteria bacterium]|nr:hypothetical protein [Candidatus Riflebacteria bacterium]